VVLDGMAYPELRLNSLHLANFALPLRFLIEYEQSFLNELTMTNPQPIVQSPCIRNCCLDKHDMCLGCFRMLDEILIWSTASSKQQHDIVLACATRKQAKPESGVR
jgi:predicted Fe-S protein YdhL (DUF1289 family)